MKTYLAKYLLTRALIGMAIVPFIGAAYANPPYYPTQTPTPTPTPDDQAKYSTQPTRFQSAVAQDSARENGPMAAQINNIVGNQIDDSLTRHLSASHSGTDIAVTSASQNAANFNVSNSNTSDGGGPDVKTMVTPPAAPQDKWGLFVNGLGGFTTLGNDSTGHSDVDNGGFIGGLDYKLTNNFVLGVTGSYSYTSFSEPFGHINDNGGKLGVYGSYFNGGWYGDFIALGGFDNYNPHFTSIPNGTSGNYSGSDATTILNGGYDQHFGQLTVGPTADFNYTYTSVGSYTQGNALGTTIPEVDTSYFQTRLGGHATYNLKVCDMLLTPELRAAWQHQLGYQGSFTPSSVALPYKIGRDSASVGAGLNLQVVEWCNVYAYYDGDLGRDKYISHNVTIGTRIGF